MNNNEPYNSGMPTSKVGSTNVKSRTEPIISGIAVVCAVAIVLGIVAGFPALAGKYLVSAPEPGPLGYAGSTLMFLDFTESESEAVRNRIRELAKDEVVAELRPGIYTAAYSLATDPGGFDEVTNRIFGDSSAAGPRVHLNLTRPPEVSVENTAALSGEWKSLQGLSRDWYQSIDALRPPRNRCCSAYLAAMAYIEGRLQNGSLPAPVKIVIMGDLREEPDPEPFVPPVVEESRRQTYNGVEVLLVRPFWVRGPHSRSEIDEYWTEYFHERGTEARLYDLNGFPGINQKGTE